MSLEAEEGFYRFWNEYPKKRSKGDAYKAWKITAPRRPPLDDLLKALAVLKVSEDWTKDNGQYIPYPGTWLRAWGWEDVPVVELKNVFKGKMWWETATGIQAQGKKFGLEWTGYRDGELESFQQFTQMVKRLSEKSNVVPIKAA